ncbi:FAD/NAD(P)-binding domain-containing protein [Acephala macrosclerotiorum]|nr:FAD/NAD(P)-binding domain-containing protein [Acephala macrosclerotiorum]
MPTRSDPQFRAIIIGGGVAGLAASIGLRRKGFHVIVLESTSRLQTLGGSLIIPPSAARVLDSYGLWETFKKSESIPPGNTTFRYEDGSVLEDVSYAAMEKTFGYPVMAIPRAKYQRMLHDAAIKAGVEVRLSSRIQCIDEKAPSVVLVNGEKMEADVIIGADGIKSTVRDAVLSGKDVQPIPESIAYQCNISGDAMRSDPLTNQLMEGGIHSWYGPARQMICGSDSSRSFYRVTLIFYPTSDKTANSLDVLAANSSSSYRKGNIQAMQETVSMFEPRVRKFAELVQPDNCFLWKISHLPPLPTWVSPSGKVAVLGDAAHAMVPHLGAGAASAVEDGGVLAECLAHAKSIADIPRALRAYQKIRKPRAERIQAAALVTGQYKIMADGSEQRKRDQRMVERMDPKHPKYEYWRAGGGLEWLYGYDFKAAAYQELDKVFGADGGDKARL